MSADAFVSRVSYGRVEHQPCWFSKLFGIFTPGASISFFGVEAVDISHLVLPFLFSVVFGTYREPAGVMETVQFTDIMVVSALC